MRFGTPRFNKDIENNDVPGKLYSWRGHTHSDVGKRARRPYTRGLMDGMAEILNKIEPGLQLQGKNFVPRFGKQQPSYENIEIIGLFGIFEVAPKLKIVLYVCGTGELGNSTKQLEAFLFDNILIEEVL